MLPLKKLPMVECVLIRVAVMHMSTFKPGTVEKNSSSLPAFHSRFIELTKFVEGAKQRNTYRQWMAMNYINTGVTTPGKSPPTFG